MEIMGMIVGADMLKKAKKYDEAEITLYKAIKKISQMRESNPSDANKAIAYTLESVAYLLLSLIQKEKEMEKEKEQIRKILNY
jgi:hypothetical protein